MYLLKRSPWLILCAMMLIASGCATSPEATPTFPPPPTFPPSSSGPTASSPLAGNWTVVTDFGEAEFAIDSTGSQVIAAKVDLRGWKCGGNTLTKSLQETSTGWTVRDGRLSVEFDLKAGHILQLRFDGRYDANSKKFSGTWEGDSYGTKCSGTWETSKHE